MAVWVPKIDSPNYQLLEFFIAGIIPTIFLVVGTIGNLISICILLKKDNRQKSTNIYLIFLCVMDTIFLYQWNLDYVVFQYSQGTKQILTQSIFLCRWVVFFSFYSLHASALFLTCVELDRACLLRSQWYKRKIAQPKIATLIVIVILLGLFGLNGFLFGLGVEFTNFDPETGITTVTIVCYYTFNERYNYFFYEQFSWIHLVIVYFVPSLIMISCTIATALKLRHTSTNNNEQLMRHAQRNRRISFMLLGMWCVYFLSSLPNRLCFSLFLDRIIGYDFTDSALFATNTLMAFRNTINIFFFYLSVNGFRRDLRQIFSRYRNKFVNRVEIEQQQNQTIETRLDGSSLPNGSMIPMVAINKQN